MPLVRITLQEGHSPRKSGGGAISQGIYHTMLETVKMSEHDRFQIILERPKDKLVADENYLDIRRTGDAVFVEITQLRGRTTEVKRALYRQIAERLSTNAGIRKEDILTSVTENDAADWCSEWAKHNPRNKRTVELGVGNSGSVADGC